MVTRYAIVALAMFVILGEVRSLKCYVCTKCLNIPEEGSNVGERDNCSACVIEDKFVLTRYVQTDRHCAHCPTQSLLMINNDKSYYDCCYDDLCLGSKRRALDEIPQDAKTGVMHKETTVNKSVEVTTTKPDNSMTQNGVIAPSTLPTSERATQNFGSSSTENEQLSALKPTLSTPHLDTAVTTDNSITDDPTTVTKGTEEITEPKKETDVGTTETPANTATHQSESLHTAADHITVLNTDSPMSNSGTAITSIGTPTAHSTTAAKPEESVPVSGGTEETAKIKKEAEGETMETSDNNVIHESANSSNAMDRMSALNTASQIQPSGAVITPTGTTTVKSTTAAEPEEITPKSPEVPSMETTAKIATENVGSSSTANPKPSAMNPKLPTQPVGTDTTNDASTTADTIPVAGGKAIPKDKIEDKNMEIPAGTTTQNLESSSPTTCQTNIRYLAFSLSLVCDFVACFN